MEFKELQIIILLTSVVLFIILTMFVLLYSIYTKKRRDCLLTQKDLEKRVRELTGE